MFISCDSRGNVPDIGVMIGDEMLTACTLFFLGDRKAEKSDDTLELCFSGSADRFRAAGFTLSFLEVVVLEVDGRDGATQPRGAGAACMGMGGASTPFSLASSCSKANLYISSSCDCAICLSFSTTVWSTDSSYPSGDRVVEDGDGRMYCARDGPGASVSSVKPNSVLWCAAWTGQASGC